MLVIRVKIGYIESNSEETDLHRLRGYGQEWMAG